MYTIKVSRLFEKLTTECQDEYVKEKNLFTVR
jgi:hypothetical protein